MRELASARVAAEHHHGTINAAGDIDEVAVVADKDEGRPVQALNLRVGRVGVRRSGVPEPFDKRQLPG